jgi:hypothetical protein
MLVLPILFSYLTTEIDGEGTEEISATMPSCYDSNEIMRTKMLLLSLRYKDTENLCINQDSDAGPPEKSINKVDVFGINKIYPTKENGREWYINTNNIQNDKLFSTSAEITKQPDGSLRVSAEHLPGDRRGDVRLEVNTPPNEDQWKDVEITGYAKVVETTGHASNRDFDTQNVFQWYARGGEHSTRVPCEGSALKGRLYLNGTAAWVKEIWHNGGYTDNKARVLAMPPLVTEHDSAGRYYNGKWFGLKVVIFNIDQAKAVKMEMYVDKNADNNWTKVNTLVDKGDWYSDDPDFDDVDCGRPRNYIVTNSGPIVGFRTDYMIWDFNNLSVREISTN